MNCQICFVIYLHKIVGKIAFYKNILEIFNFDVMAEFVSSNL